MWRSARPAPPARAPGQGERRALGVRSTTTTTTRPTRRASSPVAPLTHLPPRPPSLPIGSPRPAAARHQPPAAGVGPRIARLRFDDATGRTARQHAYIPGGICRCDRAARPRACARPRFRRRFSEPARRGGLAGARVMSYTILELRKSLVNAQTDGIRQQIPRYASAPRDRADVGAAKQVSRAGVKVTTRGIRYRYIGLIFINPRQTQIRGIAWDPSRQFEFSRSRTSGRSSRRTLTPAPPPAGQFARPPRSHRCRGAACTSRCHRSIRQLTQQRPTDCCCSFVAWVVSSMCVNSVSVVCTCVRSRASAGAAAVVVDAGLSVSPSSPG